MCEALEYSSELNRNPFMVLTFSLRRDGQPKHSVCQMVISAMEKYKAGKGVLRETGVALLNRNVRDSLFKKVNKD